jgi:phenylalanyl-tRNA synthetase beta chain
LIVQVAGGQVAKGVVDAYPKRPAAKTATLRLSRLNKLLGIEIPPEAAMRILSALGFEPGKEEDVITCTVPSWRSDVYREADLIEEVARVYGYRNVPTERQIKIEVVPVDGRQRLAQVVGTCLNAAGFYETINVGFVDDTVGELFVEGGALKHLSVRDESRKNASLLRQTLIGSLLGVLRTNVNAKNLPCRIFEIADTFIPADGQGEELPIQKTKLALVCDGDLRDMRGTLEGLIRTINKDADVVFTPAELIWADAGATIALNSETIGTAGLVSSTVRKQLDLKDVSVCAAEIEFEALMSLAAGQVNVNPIPKFPAIQRDLSIILDERVRWADVMEAINAKASPELENVQFVGIYRGKGIASGKKSVTLSLRFRDEDGTLTHETVDGLEAAIVESLTQRTGAELRTV